MGSDVYKSRFRTFALEVLEEVAPSSWRWCVDGAVVALSRADAARKMGLTLTRLGARRRVRVASQGALSGSHRWSSV